MLGNRGFTLLEALFTAVIVASGLVTVATIFSFAIQANISNRQMAVATSLVYDKMEELKWTASPSDGSEQLTLNGTYTREWRISSANPRTVTVTVYASQKQLIEVTTIISPSF